MESLRWVLLIGTEIVFWGGLAAFFTIRYVADRPDLSRYVIGFVIVEHVALLVSASSTTCARAAGRATRRSSP